MRRLLLLAALAAPSPAAAQPAVPPAEKYAPAVAALDALIAAEVDDKRLPALSVALVDDQRVVWARGYGFRDRGRTAPATAETIYRVGSVSKLFTDVAVMRLVEAGDLDLDAPVTNYLPDFKPAAEPDHEPITLRMLMAHRSGLVREPPAGNYFDPTGPTLAATVASLNGVPLIYPPGARVKYSNAAIGVVGYTLEKVRGEPFEKYVRRDVLDRLGMAASSFAPTPAVKNNLADAVMWTYHGREFPAPTFELGMAPAGCMYSTVLDLAKFASCLFAGGKAGDERLLKPETIERMFTPQFAGKDAKSGFGLGFYVDELDGHKRVGHGGAIYGFATQWAVLPAEKLGVVITCSRDVANGAVNRLADDALRLMLAAKAGKPLPEPERAGPLPADEARRLAGRYRAGDRRLDLIESGGRLFVEADRGGFRLRLKKLGNDLVTDDAEGWGVRYTPDGDALTRGGLTYTKEPPAAGPPPGPPARWKGLIGEYGWDHNTLYVYEKDGRLHALIEWTEIDPLTEESDDVFAFPADRGMYHGEKLVFARDKTGRATKVTAAGIVFERRAIDGENGETFTVTPQRPLDQLRREALAAKPPAEPGEFRKPDLVDLAAIDGMKFDIRYATENNFLKTTFYPSAGAYLQRPAADALARVHAGLKDKGYGLLVFDAYRPWHVTRMFWDATPPKFRNFVADPARGSRHNRGCAVDLTLYDLETGRPVEMVGGFDEFSDRAYPDYPGGTSRQRWHRDLLRRAMAAEGFAVYEEEWWHFDYKDWPRYPILNVPFGELGRRP
jgi:serine beta-lactamase-like protein LACTB